MKIQKKEASKVFQPITLEITIESEDELIAILELSKHEAIISRYAYDTNMAGNSFQKQAISNFLCGTYVALKS